jgi:hypothetical protein
VWIGQKMIARKAVRLGWVNPVVPPQSPPPAAAQTVKLDQMIRRPVLGNSSDGGS